MNDCFRRRCLDERVKRAYKGACKCDIEDNGINPVCGADGFTY